MRAAELLKAPIHRKSLKKLNLKLKPILSLFNNAIKVNRNYFWSNIFIDQLAECGVKYACISPGSRSTPLTYALSQNKKIKSYVIIDERTFRVFCIRNCQAN